MVLGYLLARAGVKVTVLEKHVDFLRDFRGDTVHPSTVALLRELGLADRFLDLPLSRVKTLDTVIDGHRFGLADFSTLPGPDNFLVFAPQWDFLNFIAAEGETLPGFDLRMNSEVEELCVENGRVVGLRARTDDGDLDVRAVLTVAADGRSSVLRDEADMRPVEVGVPIDVLWFRLPKPHNPPPSTLGYISRKAMVLTLDRGDYYQSGVLILKGSFEQIQAEGLDVFRSRLAFTAPHLADVVSALQDWGQIKLLSVQLNQLTTWHRPGFIAIGDAAHAMSPLFGVGVNYAIQDAVALSNAVVPHLARGHVPEDVLTQVQERRQRPVRKMQRLQRLGHLGITRIASAKGGRAVPRPLVGLLRFFSPRFRGHVAEFIGYGYLPEHPASSLY